ncbi:conserved hypothetical protein [Methylomarinovum tepidoasis]|uniref:GTP-binding protein n=1 Tax=Methylomarinovum tepidoasis TaxID=2840183 RepID=A0AAU9CXM6_9GAMM|nr:ATP/GTP-binding protein [Methylomarinovum sp. IN45]BCX89455.1 conserved hypothetical protein [Methylomarinovum sp. IN45]
MKPDKVYDKLIFTGPVGAGKTTAIASISDTPPVRTDACATDMTLARKPETTVALDYGVLRLDDGSKLHLYGTPGQERFDFMWEILIRGGIGLVLLLDNTRPDPFQDMRFFLQRFRSFIDATGVVVGVTRMDLKAAPPLESYHKSLEQLGLRAPVLEIDARRREDVALLVQTLLFHLNPGILMEESDA